LSTDDARTEGADAPSIAEAVASATDSYEVQMTRLQRAVARRMTASVTEVPQFMTEVEVDMAAVDGIRLESRRAGAPTPSYNDFVIKACALALRQVPQLNASFSDDRFTFHRAINVGFAVAQRGVLVVPTIFNADHKSLAEIARCAASLAAKVRDRSIRADELAGGTFTVSNLGMHGMDRFTALINPPQAGILAVGAVRERVVADEGRPEVRKRMAVTLTADHRIVYGTDAAEFLNAFRTALETWDGGASPPEDGRQGDGQGSGLH
jgi:pyruvate dehydrogenase E2 component (dihydrolipoamide acetyltransferase)